MNWYRIKNKMISRVSTRFSVIARKLVAGYRPLESRDIPWTPLIKMPPEATLAVVTTAGVHHRDQPRFDMNDKDGDPSYREIDAARPLGTLMITHDYYDHTDADRDLNIVFPVERLREFVDQGFIRRLAARHYSFMGHITGRHIKTLLTKTAPDVADRLRRDGVDVVLLTPG